MAADRIETLIAQMTVEEKVGQLGVFADMVRPFAPDVNPEANVSNADQVLQQVREGKVGSLFNGVGVEAGRRIQQVALEESRLGIPVILAADVIHGMRTVFPIPLGEAASFEPELAERTARATAVEATAAGLHWTYAPAVDIARDQRWAVAPRVPVKTWCWAVRSPPPACAASRARTCVRPMRCWPRRSTLPPMAR